MIERRVILSVFRKSFLCAERILTQEFIEKLIRRRHALNDDCVRGTEGNVFTMAKYIVKRKGNRRPRVNVNADSIRFIQCVILSLVCASVFLSLKIRFFFLLLLVRSVHEVNRWFELDLYDLPDNLIWIIVVARPLLQTSSNRHWK